MDNLTHSVAAWTLARAGLERQTPYATTALIIGANMPDLDVFSQFTGGILAYLDAHRGNTHSFFGILPQALVLAVGLWLVNQAIRRKNQKHPQARFVPLLLVSAIGLFSHVLMDFPNNYGIRLWLPFSNQWSYGDFVFVVDPWLFLILAGALFLSGKRGMQTILLWAIAGIILTLLILLFPYARLGVKVVWLILIGALAALRHRLKNISSQRYARLALALAALYYGIMFGFKWRAAKLLADALRPAEVIAQVVTPMPGNIFQWAVFRETGERVDFGRINHIFAEPQIQWVKNFPKNFEAPFVQAALQTCTGRVMLDFARYPAAMIEEDRAGFRVSLYDVRSATLFSTRGENWAKASVIVHKDLTTEEPEPCPR